MPVGLCEILAHWIPGYLQTALNNNNPPLGGGLGMEFLASMRNKWSARHLGSASRGSNGNLMSRGGSRLSRFRVAISCAKDMEPLMVYV